MVTDWKRDIIFNEIKNCVQGFYLSLVYDAMAPTLRTIIQEPLFLKRNCPTLSQRCFTQASVPRLQMSPFDICPLPPAVSCAAVPSTIFAASAARCPHSRAEAFGGRPLASRSTAIFFFRMGSPPHPQSHHGGLGPAPVGEFGGGVVIAFVCPESFGCLSRWFQVSLIVGSCIVWLNCWRKALLMIMQESKRLATAF